MVGELGHELRASPAKRPKTLDTPHGCSAKGKEKMEEPDPDAVEESSSAASAAAPGDLYPAAAEAAAEEEEEEECGICLSGGGRSIRGRVDSCDHYFCFVCIMEWAKIESRCPLCKRRFQSIRRPPMPGVFPSERVVDVAVRDQVYHPLGNESTRLADPYANTSCSLCHSSSDEELLLLCDLCDSAAHTYCVGLGATVPEGDWYCPDCAVSRNEHSKNQFDDESYNREKESTCQIRAYVPSISIFDIVADEDTSDSSSRYTGRQILETQRYDRESPSKSTSQINKVEIGARTLQNCRNLHERIRTLRENWNALREGSLEFSSNFIDSSIVSERGKVSGRTTAGVIKQQDSLLAIDEEVINSGVSSKKAKCAGSRDVNKAWKMMEIAKSINGKKLPTKSDNHLSSSSTKSFFREAEICSGSSLVESKTANNLVVKMGRSRNNGSSLELVHQKYEHYDHGKQTWDMHATNEAHYFNFSPTKAHLSLYTEESSLMRDKFSFCDLESYSQKKVNDTTFHDSSIGCSRNNNATGDVGPLDKLENHILAKDRPVGNAKLEARTRIDDRLPRKVGSTMNDTAKGEIQSLVKLNLKLLNKDKRLGADSFREVARIATHTILAACGLEHSRSSARPFSRSVCKHSEKVKQLRKCNLMPSSCRECFYTFVQEVVKSVLSENCLDRTNADRLY
ncbi:PHD and RING finger domain-containing protein C126.07c-like [Ananas comosus]|uniref:PHD and RING finger domain-containing protein C126.07c-like n=1 Tax=Ananas comosus TaxID=4615 RepID=A0A6P5F2J7_ANACO|nr:PHD and RING finger domain-containing protein C126.07c-like [Ananas comosus]